uniref:Uncharacterized protein n=1 Tax=Setaria viridis TaxID=4556 RepID=A0A4U6TW39_SETVI|nr:hypothetical protein SEVIR_7G282250v2 [Setaria viridis]
MALTWLAGAATERPSGRAAREVLDEMARGPLKASCGRVELLTPSDPDPCDPFCELSLTEPARLRC